MTAKWAPHVFFYLVQLLLVGLEIFVNLIYRKLLALQGQDYSKNIRPRQEELENFLGKLKKISQNFGTVKN